MKAKDRRRFERQAAEIRKESGLPILDVRKLIASSDIMQRIIQDAANQANQPARKGDDGSDEGG